MSKTGPPRTFHFADSESVLNSQIQNLEIAVATSGRTHLFFGDPMDGTIRVFDRNLRRIRELDAYPNGTVTHLKLALSANRLFSIGDESREHVAVLQQWDLNNGARVGAQRLFHPEKDPAPSERTQLRFNYNSNLKLQLKGNSSVSGSSGGDSEAEAFAAAAQQQATSDSLYSCVSHFDVTEDGKQFALALANGEVLVGFGADRGTARTRRIKLRKAPSGEMPVFVGFPHIAAPQTDSTLLSRFTALSGSVEVAWPYLFVVFRSCTVLLGLPSKLADPVEECLCLAPTQSSNNAAAVSAGNSSLGAASGDACFIDHQQLWVASPIVKPSKADEAAADPDRLPERPRIPVTVFNPLGALDPRMIQGGKLPLEIIGTPKPVLSHPDYFEGEKLALGMHRGYVYVLTRPDPDRKPDKFYFTLLDEEAHIRAVVPRDSVHQNVAWVLPDQSDIILVLQEPKAQTVQQKVVRFTEVNMQSKLDQLFRKEFYSDALKIVQKQHKHGGASAPGGPDGQKPQQVAASQQGRGGAKGGGSSALHMLSEDELLQQEVEMRYGDHLFTKGRYSEAIEKYISAIRRVDPSVVIRKFLDVHRIADLTKYLEALHRRDLGLANENHTTLLLNSYTKLRDEQKLQEFIDRDEFKFDARNAIAVCRQANYFGPAKSLARKYREHSEYINILLDNTKEYQEAVRFIRSMRTSEAWKVIADRGKLLIDKLPREATECFRELICAGYDGGKQFDGRGGSDPQLAERRVAAASFIPLFVDTPFWLHHFLRYIVEKLYTPGAPPPAAAAAPVGGDDLISSDRPKATEATATNEVFNTLLELLVARDIPERLAVGQAMGGGGGGVDNASTASAITADSAAAAAAAASSSAASQQQQFSMDLTVQPEARRRRAVEVLQKYTGHYDAYHALVLAHQNNFEEGVLLLLQQLDLHGEVFGFYAKVFEQASTIEQYRNARQKLEETCIERQNKARSEAAAAGGGGAGGAAANSAKALWVSFLALLLRADAQKFPDVASDVTRVLQIIASEDLLPPVAAIELLSTCRSLPLRAAKQYVLEAIQRQQRTLESAEADVHKLETLNNKVREDLVRLSTTAQVFQATKCTQCGEPLELPVVHFLCRHAYHKKCLNDPRECTECGAKNRRLMLRRREQEEVATDHEAFFAKLRDQSGGKTDLFSVVAQQFGMGVFTTATGAAPGASAETKQKGAFDSDDEEDGDDDLLNDRTAIAEKEQW